MLDFQKILHWKKIANETGLSVSYLSELERGEKGNPSAIILRSISKAYNLSLEELLKLLEETEEKGERHGRNSIKANFGWTQKH